MATPKHLNHLLWLSLLSLANSLRVFRRFIQQYPRTYFPNSTPWKNKQKMTSHVRSHYSQAYKVITPFCMTRFANWKLAPTMQSYGGYHGYDSSSIEQNPPIASLNLLMIRLLVTGVLFSELTPMATISSSDFTLMELILQPDNLQPSSPFFLGTTMVFYDGHFLKLFISASGTSWTDSMRGHKRFNPHKNALSDDQHLLSRMKLSLLTSTNTSRILNFSAKLADVVNDSCYIGMSFSDPIVQKSTTQKLPFPPFP